MLDDDDDDDVGYLRKSMFSFRSDFLTTLATPTSFHSELVFSRAVPRSMKSYIDNIYLNKASSTF
jgi:hypothetical protein